MMGKKKSENSKNPFKKQSFGNDHIYFDETGEIVSTTTKIKSNVARNTNKKRKAVVIFRCPLQDATKEDDIAPNARIFQIKRNSSENRKQKQLIEIREDLVLAPLPVLSFENNNLSVEKITADEHVNEGINIKLPETVGKSNSLMDQSALSNKTDITKTTTLAKTNEDLSDNSLETSQSKNSTKVYPSKQEETSKLLSNNINPHDENCMDVSIDLEACGSPQPSEREYNLSKDEKKIDKSSDVEEISEIIDLNETEDNCNSTADDSTINSSFLDTSIRIGKILPYCSPMLDMPKINDIIVFKVCSLYN